MFCPKCGSILVPKKDDGKKVLVCSCGYKSTDSKDAVIRETVKGKAKEVEVVSDQRHWFFIKAKKCNLAFGIPK